MPFGVQDVIVALAALGAAVVAVRRVIGFATAETSPKCASCESGGCAPSPAPRSHATEPAHPLVFIRPPQR